MSRRARGFEVGGKAWKNSKHFWRFCGIIEPSAASAWGNRVGDSSAVFAPAKKNCIRGDAEIRLNCPRRPSNEASLSRRRRQSCRRRLRALKIGGAAHIATGLSDDMSRAKSMKWERKLGAGRPLKRAGGVDRGTHRKCRPWHLIPTGRRILSRGRSSREAGALKLSRRHF